jgi:hypothetical protein
MLILGGLDPIVMALQSILLCGAILLAKSRLDVEKAQLSISLKRLDDLQSQGLRLYISHTLPPNPTSWEQTRDLLLAKYEIGKWIYRVQRELGAYPVFAPIFEAHGGGGPRQQLRGRLQRLHEIRSLLAATRRVALPRS